MSVGLEDVGVVTVALLKISGLSATVGLEGVVSLSFPLRVDASDGFSDVFFSFSSDDVGLGVKTGGFGCIEGEGLG
jgi:hypothetical protein